MDGTRGRASIRLPAAAGTFYPDDPRGLERALDACFEAGGGTHSKGCPIALICPHAGYVYSGSAAASAYSAIPDGQEMDVVAILGPNHTGLGTPVSVSSSEKWESVGKTYQVDGDAAAALYRAFPQALPDEMAHLSEHSLEVHLPFLSRRLAGSFRLLPIAVGLAPNERGLEAALELGRALASVLRGRRALLVASTDMSHYVSEQRAREMDAHALDAIERLAPAGLVRAVREHRISMCGVMPTAAVLEAAIQMGASRAVRTAYTNSGEVSGDRVHVVSYAAFAVF